MTFEEIKSKLEQLKTKRDRAVGAKEQIEASWLSKYGSKDIADIQSQLVSMKKEISDLESEYADKMARAEELLKGAVV